jgi:alpha-L-glutamate ligase-like protein
MLFNHGILGINARNLLFIKPYNKEKGMFLADNKLQTKRFLEMRDIPVPKLLGSIQSYKELREYPIDRLPISFVVKPNTGYGGEGILVIIDHKKNGDFVLSNGGILSRSLFIEHLEDIVDGNYSISEHRDTVLFEERIITHSSLTPFVYKGLPDIRIIVFNLIPVMAMLRLPTKESHGKANLHQGALGCGIDIGTGEVTYISSKNKLVSDISDAPAIKGFRLPYWEKILMIASKIQYVTNIGYLAVDIALDEKRGPMLLEINARAGLNVQIANQAPLRTRLEKVKDLKIASPEKGVRLAQDLFGKRIQKKIELLSGKSVIGPEEIIELPLREKSLFFLGKISTRTTTSSLHTSIFQQLCEEKKVKITTPFLSIKLMVDTHKINVVVRPRDLSKQDYKLILGKNDLREFIIDPFKYQKEQLQETLLQRKDLFLLQKRDSIDPQLIISDRILAHIDQYIDFLFLLKPTNIEEEKKHFIEQKGWYNPHFTYLQPSYHTGIYKDQLRQLFTDSSILGNALLKKKEELLQKIRLIESRGEDASLIQQLSSSIFPGDIASLLPQAQEVLRTMESTVTTSNDVCHATDVQHRFIQQLEHYHLDNWHVSIVPSLSSRIAVGKSRSIKIRDDILFPLYKVESSLRHEIDTHVLRAENGKKQPYKLFHIGTAGYLETEEGLAIYLQNSYPPAYHHSLLTSAGHILTLWYGQNHSFAETAAYIRQELHLNLEESFLRTMRQKRGITETSNKGVFMKDIVYFKGYLEIQRFVQNGGDLRQLYYGKIHIRDITEMLHLPHLKQPYLLPPYIIPPV